MALDDYFSDPSQDCLARLFDAVNAMDLSGAPLLTRQEKIVMRSSERKDIFSEKFGAREQNWSASHSRSGAKSTLQHKSTNSGESYSSFEGELFSRQRQEENRSLERELPTAPDNIDITAVSASAHLGINPDSPSDTSFSLGGSAVWVGDESGLDLATGKDAGDSLSVFSLGNSNTIMPSSRKRRSTDASSLSSLTQGKDMMTRTAGPPIPPYFDRHLRAGLAKDTHFYHTTVAYKDHLIPIQMPLFTLPEEVGDVRLVLFIAIK